MTKKIYLQSKEFQQILRKKTNHSSFVFYYKTNIKIHYGWIESPNLFELNIKKLEVISLNLGKIENTNLTTNRLTLAVLKK
jgi:hypothetical protein